MVAILETKRLILKAPESSHFKDLVALRTDPDVMRYIGSGNVQTVEQVGEFLNLADSYFKKYGMTFFSVFEKNTGDFVGQAGLLHSYFDDTQPDIELAYRLHKKYWRQGYATELGRALIDWGFNVKLLPRIVAILDPENEASRRVLEKSGMTYHGLISFREAEIPCYEIINHKINFDDIKLCAAAVEEYPVIQNMGRFYVYDMSEYLGKESGWEIPEDGLYECIDFKKYWEDSHSFPLVVRYKNEVAGFAIVDKKGSHAEIDYNMAQFFILRKFKNKGIGSYVAQECFKKFSGIWEVMVIPGNEGAYRFWRVVVKNYTNNNFSEYTRDIAHFNHSRKNIIKFDSRLHR